jgi:threonyl-tRNA synthetase
MTATAKNPTDVNTQEYLDALRHSCAHVMAQAVQELYPGTKITIGPAIENGFYYDFDGPHHFTDEDLKQIEKKMRQIAEGNHPFTGEEKTFEESKKYWSDRDEKYKLELLDGIKQRGEKITHYTHSTFTDLCRGGHLESTKGIRHFKLQSVAGAYWRGDEKNPMLQRIYGTAWPSKQQLDDYLKMLVEAKLRDHRKLGKELKIFTFDDEVGPGLPLWLPNGAMLIEGLEALAKQTEAAAGYHRVKTPHICKESMYLRSGHLPYYAESMFPPMELDGMKYYLKPMNCPHHHKIYGAEPRSYRDLPLRLAEYGTCYRFEQSGELFGLMRVRSMQMNDAHIYCTIEQFEEEFLAVCRMYLEYFKIFGIEKYVMRFSKHAASGLGKKYVDQPELWKKTEAMVLRALQNGKIAYKEVEDEAAFYGPKIDVQVWSAIGREFTLATNQVDFAVPARFNLEYKTSEGKAETPLCIHRAPLGTHERFIGFLIEHFGGHFPLWLSPVQVKVLSLTEEQAPQAKALAANLEKAGLRVALDLRNDKIGGKIRDAQLEKVPYMVILGPKDVAASVLSVRLSDGRQFQGLQENDFIAKLTDEVSAKKTKPDWGNA